MRGLQKRRGWYWATVLLWVMMVGVLLGPGGQAAWADTDFQWTWMKGSSNAYGAATYGTPGVAAAANTPGAREDAVTWTDSSGNLWLFGGSGKDGAESLGRLNDLWKYDRATGNWAWMKGSSTKDQSGVYGTVGIAAADNSPGGRTGAVTWTDSVGKLWLFGGYTYDSVGTWNGINDLWKYDPSTGNWTWMKGSSTGGQAGTYGTLGTPAAANTPGQRYGSVSWVDSSGALWLFGGYGGDKGGSLGLLNDLWKYDPGTGFWVWMKGSDTKNPTDVYGTRRKYAAANTPGGRSGAVSWTDPSGTLWLFGGKGLNSEGTQVFHNDLWQYNPGTGFWAWMKGSTAVNQSGVYGTQGVPDDANTPGARHLAVSWIDASGVLWLFGGSAYDSTGTFNSANDLWKFEKLVGLGTWTWVKGASTGDGNGVYGTLRMPSADNTPGARRKAVSWTDPSGALWLLGGYGYDDDGHTGLWNDLWRWQDAVPPTGTIVVNNNRSVTNNVKVILSLAWSDGVADGSGVVRMKFSNDAVTWTAWEPLSATREWSMLPGDGYKTVRVMYRDKAGNNSPVHHDYIRLDTTPPTGSIIINGGASSTTNRTVSLGLTWDDGMGSGVSRMRFSIDGATWSAWEPQTTPKSYTLPAAPLGYYTVRVQYLDAGNNYSPVYNDYIKLVAP